MKDRLMTNGGAYIGDKAKSGRDFIGRDLINITVQEPYLQQIWPRLDADLQDALSLASNQVLRERGEAIAMMHLLQALVRLRPDLAEEILPLLMLHKAAYSEAESTMSHNWKEGKLMDVNPTLQETLEHLLANFDTDHLISCADLLSVFQSDDEHPFPWTLNGIQERDPFKGYSSRDCISKFCAATGSSITANILGRRAISMEKVQARWN